ncbi:MAG: serine protease [Synergistes jonesii]|uniref:S1 family peptidase n=1 Tax=Synergistes jonesii TaxID=2754 RepID=UPI002A74E564|nr:serine protease [Synergistes jonesii]MDY2985513.1 serine protease [Synergistes jonesii]
MALIPQFFINSVVSIGISNNSHTAWIGTGFFCVRKVDKDGNVIPFLVTNRHVLERQNTIILRFTDKSNGNLKEVPAPLSKNGNVIYKLHPNSKIDIAVLPLNGKFIVDNNLEFNAFDIDENALTTEELRKEGVDEGSLIYMLGYPMGLVNVNSKLPICRLGCVARMSEEQIQETGNLLVDIQNFPGNSGSPIVTRPEMMAISGTKALDRSVLLGIVYSYIPYRENLVNQQTREIVETRSENSGIALVHPVEQIRQVVDFLVPQFVNKGTDAEVPEDM